MFRTVKKTNGSAKNDKKKARTPLLPVSSRLSTAHKKIDKRKCPLESRHQPFILIFLFKRVEILKKQEEKPMLFMSWHRSSNEDADTK